MRQRRLPFATRDEQGRLRVGAAIGATGDYLERAAELVRAGVDVLVIDIAHGHSVVMERAMTEFRKKFSDVELIAGNVATGDGATLPARARRRRHQGRDRSRRRLHDAHDDQFRRAAAAGAGGMPARDGRLRRAAHCRRRHQAARRRSPRRSSSAATASCSAARSPAPKRRRARSCTSRCCCRSRRRR